MELRVYADAEARAAGAAEIFRARVATRPELAMAVPAGRTPRRMFELLRQRLSLCLQCLTRALAIRHRNEREDRATTPRPSGRWPVERLRRDLDSEPRPGKRHTETRQKRAR